jgi:CRP-like cAMP-binding protein
MPALSHDQLLMATRRAKVQRYDPGAMILNEGTSGNLFYIVSKGSVEILLPRTNAADVIAAQMGPGQYFGEMEFIHGQKRSASVRAAERGGQVEVLTLSFDTLRDLLDTSDATREEMQRIADERKKENLAVRGGLR